MKAMILERNAPIETAPLRLREVPAPEPARDELQVRVETCGICRTDLHVIEMDLPQGKLPVIPGHQVVGRVAKRGSGVKGFETDERVGIGWLRRACGECSYCRRGDENLCPEQRFTGYHADGGFAQYAVVPADFAYRIPEGLDPAEATPLLCAGIIGYRALKRSGFRPGSRLALYGFGSSAHIVIQLALHRGATVYVITRGEKHRRFARELGAYWVGESTEGLPDKADHAILFAPAGGLVPPALEALDRGGTLALAGIHVTDIPSLNYQRHLFYEKNLHSVTANTRRDGEELLEAAAAGGVKARLTRFPLEEANQALLMLKRDELAGTGVIEL